MVTREELDSFMQHLLDEGALEEWVSYHGWEELIDKYLEYLDTKASVV